MRENCIGVDVLLLDKQKFPRDKICAGWITPPVLDLLGIKLDDFPSDDIVQPITGFRTGIIGGKEIHTEYGRAVSYGIRRCEFDHFLLKRSEAPCRLGEPLKKWNRDGNGWIVNDEITANIIVGAGGHFCPVGRRLGNRKQPAASVVKAQEAEFAVPEEELNRGSISAETPELFFCPDLKGYGWCFRKGNYLNIGLGRTDDSRVSEHVKKFCDFLRSRGKIACSLPERFHGHAYQLYERISPKLLDDGLLLIGDSAGLSYPQSGEGIRPAVESGLMAADVILSCSGDYSRESLQQYGEKIVARFGEPRGNAATDWLPAGWLRFFAARLLANRWFSRRVVLDNWFLHAKEPALTQQYP